MCVLCGIHMIACMDQRDRSLIGRASSYRDKNKPEATSPTKRKLDHNSESLRIQGESAEDSDRQDPPEKKPHLQGYADPPSLKKRWLGTYCSSNEANHFLSIGTPNTPNSGAFTSPLNGNGTFTFLKKSTSYNVSQINASTAANTAYRPSHHTKEIVSEPLDDDYEAMAISDSTTDTFSDSFFTPSESSCSEETDGPSSSTFPSLGKRYNNGKDAGDYKNDQDENRTTRCLLNMYHAVSTIRKTKESRQKDIPYDEKIELLQATFDYLAKHFEDTWVYSRDEGWKILKYIFAALDLVPIKSLDRITNGVAKFMVSKRYLKNPSIRDFPSVRSSKDIFRKYPVSDIHFLTASCNFSLDMFGKENSKLAESFLLLLMKVLRKLKVKKFRYMIQQKGSQGLPKGFSGFYHVYTIGETPSEDEVTIVEQGNNIWPGGCNGVEELFTTSFPWLLKIKKYTFAPNALNCAILNTIMHLFGLESRNANLLLATEDSHNAAQPSFTLRINSIALVESGGKSNKKQNSKNMPELDIGKNAEKKNKEIISSILALEKNDNLSFTFPLRCRKNNGEEAELIGIMKKYAEERGRIEFFHDFSVYRAGRLNKSEFINDKIKKALKEFLNEKYTVKLYLIFPFCDTAYNDMRDKLESVGFLIGNQYHARKIESKDKKYVIYNKLLNEFLDQLIELKESSFPHASLSIRLDEGERSVLEIKREIVIEMSNEPRIGDL